MAMVVDRTRRYLPVAERLRDLGYAPGIHMFSRRGCGPLEVPTPLLDDPHALLHRFPVRRGPLPLRNSCPVGKPKAEVPTAKKPKDELDKNYIRSPQHPDPARSEEAAKFERSFGGVSNTYGWRSASG